MANINQALILIHWPVISPSFQLLFFFVLNLFFLQIRTLDYKGLQIRTILIGLWCNFLSEMWLAVQLTVKTNLWRSKCFQQYQHFIFALISRFL